MRTRVFWLSLLLAAVVLMPLSVGIGAQPAERAASEGRETQEVPCTVDIEALRRQAAAAQLISRSAGVSASRVRTVVPSLSR